MQNDDTPRARRLLRGTLLDQPQDVRTWLLLGWTSASQRGAEACFRRALMLDPGNALAQDGLEWAAEADFTTQVARRSKASLNQAGSAQAIFTPIPEEPQKGDEPAPAALRWWGLAYSWYLALYLLG
ncbi:MAG: hypothetical protein JSV61_09535, partial [Anaerolineales bacterium]